MEIKFKSDYVSPRVAIKQKVNQSQETFSYQKVICLCIFPVIMQMTEDAVLVLMNCDKEKMKSRVPYGYDVLEEIRKWKKSFLRTSGIDKERFDDTMDRICNDADECDILVKHLYESYRAECESKIETRDIVFTARYLVVKTLLYINGRLYESAFKCKSKRLNEIKRKVDIYVGDRETKGAGNIDAKNAINPAMELLEKLLSKVKKIYEESLAESNQNIEKQ